MSEDYQSLIMSKIADLQQRVRWLEHQKKVSRRFEIALLAAWLFVSVTHIATIIWRMK